eukprot:jgi/Astpho2/8533/fgenesh1_pg.00125_%23_37_t
MQMSFPPAVTTPMAHLLLQVWEADGHVGGVAGTAWPGLNISVLGRDNQRWDNYTAGATFPVLQKHCAEIERFLMEQLVLGKLQLLQFVPIGWLLRLWRFSDEFKQDVVYPIVGSFNGTGGSMDATPAAVTASALMHPAFKIFQADRRTMLAPATSGPEVFIFPNLRNLYDKMAEELRLKGTTICLGRPVDSLHFVRQHGSTSDRWLVKSQGQEGVFDSVILACPGDLALKMLRDSGAPAAWKYSAMLGAIDYADVPIITHTDVDYLRQNYHVSISQDYNTTPFWMVRHADGGPGRGTELELSYACLTVDEAGQAGPTRVCQTNFRMDADLDGSKIVHRRNARHMRTTAANFLRTVLFSRIAQGHNGAFLCGAYLFGNPHEAAITSGFAAAEALGGSFPFTGQNSMADWSYNLLRFLLYGKGQLPALPKQV